MIFAIDLDEDGPLFDRSPNDKGLAVGVGKATWRGGRVVECARLESVCRETYRGFESLPLRHFKP